MLICKNKKIKSIALHHQFVFSVVLALNNKKNYYDSLTIGAYKKYFKVLVISNWQFESKESN